MAELSREEFVLHIELLRGDIKGVHERLDKQNGRLGEAEQSIAVLEDRAGTGKAAVVGGGVAGLVYGAIEVIKWFRQ